MAFLQHLYLQYVSLPRRAILFAFTDLFEASGVSTSAPIPSDYVLYLCQRFVARMVAAL